jgi:hypothetical protein
MRIRTLAALALAAGALVPTSAFANDCTAATGNGADPQINDPANDYNGTVGGNQTALIPYGDVHGEGTDLIAGWVSIGADGKTYANISSRKIDGLQVNSTFGFRWVNDAGLPAQNRRFVQVQFNERGTATYEHGYIALDPQTGIDNVNTLGSTTGTVTNGTPGVISIAIPWGTGTRIPKPTVLAEATIESRVLIGARGTGLLGLADDSTDGDGPCFNITP